MTKRKPKTPVPPPASAEEAKTPEQIAAYNEQVAEREEEIFDGEESE